VDWDSYLDATVRQKIRRDGRAGRGARAIRLGYLNSNQDAAQNTRDFFITRPATNATFFAISNRAQIFNTALVYGQGQWNTLSLPRRTTAVVRRYALQYYFPRTAPVILRCCPLTARCRSEQAAGSQAVQGEPELFRRQQPHAGRHVRIRAVGRFNKSRTVESDIRSIQYGVRVLAATSAASDARLHNV